MKRLFRTLVLLPVFTFISQLAFSQVPILNSDPSSAQTIYLDFDGQYVTGTSWNWGGPIAAAPASLGASAITEIFNRVAEDYRPFTVNVTTDSIKYNRAPAAQRIRMIVTPTSAWYGRAGGVSFVGSFSWGDDTPGWVFCELLGNNTKYVAEACSHEIGHTLGLQHQSVYDQNCTKTAEYNPGTGDGEIGWAPIMGVSYYQNLTTWHTGPSSEGCGVIQNDLSVITSAANGIAFRNDDYGNTPIESASVNMQGNNFQVSGQITKTNDIDAFSFTLDRQTGFKLTAVPNNVGLGNLGADVDIKIFIMNSRFDTIGIYNPSMLLDAIIDTSLARGTYYLSIAATGNAYHSNYGSLGNYALRGTVESILPINEFVLKADDQKGTRGLSWSYVTDEKVQELVLEGSRDGRNFQSVSVLSPGRAYYSITSGDLAYYRLHALTLLTQQTYYSNIVHVDGGNTARNAKAINTLVDRSIKVSSDGAYRYQLVSGTGALVSTGQVAAGITFIDASKLSKGLALLTFNNGSESWTEKLIKE